MDQLPPYITRYETHHSASSNDPFIAKGLVTTGPNTARYVSVSGKNKEQVHAQFLAAAAVAFGVKGA